MIKRLRNTLRLGRIFRRIGLPPLTLAGIGISGIWFAYLGTIFQNLVRDLLGLNAKPFQAIDYLPMIFSAVLPFLAIFAISFWLNGPGRSPSVDWGSVLKRPEGKQGLILLASNPNSAEFAIRYHLIEQGTLKRVWIIASDDKAELQFGQGTYPAALQIRVRAKALAESIGKPLKVDICRPVSPADSQDTFDEVNSIFRKSGYETRDIIADFTGGTKPMSVGMIMACLRVDRELEYVSFNKPHSYGPFLVDYQYSAFDLIG
jgi:hypothetical protein